MRTIIEQARLFHNLHRGGEPVVLANAWDVASARVIEDAGAPAIATTSAGVAWSLGVADGDRLGRDRALAAVARVAAAVRVPVTADIENGFADDAAGVAETVRGVLAAGAVGVNLEDAVYGDDGVTLRDPAEQAERIAAARQAADAEGVPLYINARIDMFLRAVGDPAARLHATLGRAAAYLAAGASGVFVPGVVDPETISALVAGLGAPLNILAGPGAPSIPQLAALGVARVSLGSSLAQAAYDLAQRAAREAFAAGTYESLNRSLDYGQLNALLSRGV
jgi:2-methylisocitrate lyase-like PEP mutase family enzyme